MEQTANAVQTAATNGLTWLISSATSVLNFMTSNTLIMFLLGVGMAGIAASFVGRFIRTRRG